MKTNALLLALAIVALMSSVAPKVMAQERPILFGGGGPSVSEEKVPLILGAGYGSFGPFFEVGVAFNDATKLPGLALVGEFCENAQLGLELGFQPVALFTDGLYLHTGLEWQYEVKIITTDFHPTNQTFNGEDRMFISLRIGPEFEKGRFGFGFYLNSGQTWIPSSNPLVQDWRWTKKVSGRFYMKF